MKTKILIVEDEESILKGLTDLLVYHGYEIETANDGKEGLSKALKGSYHLILLDIMLPEVDGLTICNEIRKKDRSQPVIMLTAKGDEEDIVQGLKLGADDYITKPFSLKELLARIEAVLRRSPKLIHDQSMIFWKDLKIDQNNLKCFLRNQEWELTRREVDLLAYLIKYHHRPISRRELLKEVWGYSNTFLDTRTVDIHIAKLRKKMEQNPSQPKIILTLRGEGYKLGKNF